MPRMRPLCPVSCMLPRFRARGRLQPRWPHSVQCRHAPVCAGWPADSRKPGQAHPPRGAVQLRHTPYTTRVDRELAALARAHAHRKPASPLAVCAAALCGFDHSPGTAPADLGVLQPAQEPTYAATPDRTQRTRHDEWRAAGGSTQSDGSSTPRSGSADSGAAAAATRGGGSAAGGELAVDFSAALRRSGVVATDSRLDLHSALSRPPSPPMGWPLSDSPARRPLVEARGGVARFAESGGDTRIPSISESESLSGSYASCAQLSSSDLPAAQPDPASLPPPLPPLASVATKRASLAAMPAFPRSPGPRPGHAVARERRASLAAEGAAPETSAIASRGANFDLPVRHRFSQLAGTPHASASASPLQSVAPFGADLHATPFSEARPTQLPPPSATDIHVSTAGAQTVRGGVVMGRRAMSPAATQPAPPANALADRKAPALARTSACPGCDSAAQGTRFAPAQRLRAPQRPASAAAAVRRPWQPDAAAHGPRSAEARAPLGVDAALVPRGAQRRAALEGVFAK